MGKNKKELDEMLSSDSECEKIKEKKVKKKKAKNVDEEEDNEDNKVININEMPSEKEKKKNKERKCSDTKEEEDDVKESKKKKNKKDKVKKVAESSDDEDEMEDNKKKKKTKDDDDEEEEVEIKKKDKKKAPVKDDDDDDGSDDEVVVKKKKQKKVERKSSSSSEDIVIEKPKKTSKTKIEEDNDKDDDNSDEDDDEEVKPKNKKTKPKKETKEDDDEEDDDENEDKDKEKPKAKDNNNNNTQNEEPPQKHLQQKSYSSGTWPELFIKNLSYNTTDVGLADFFSKYGDVEETKVVYDKQSGRSKGVGFCRFYDASSAVKAMEDAGKLTLDGRPIAISYSNERPSATNTQPKFKADTSYQGTRYGLFVGNLSFKSNEQGIKNLFEDCGKIIDIRIAKNEQGKMRGFAHVDFDSSESVDKALKKNGFKLDGRELKLDRSESKPARGGNVGQGKGRNNAKVDDVTKAKKSGAIIAPKENKVIQFNDSDDDNDE